jgi:hypothetical protein
LRAPISINAVVLRKPNVRVAPEARAARWVDSAAAFARGCASSSDWRSLALSSVLHAQVVVVVVVV